MSRRTMVQWCDSRMGRFYRDLRPGQWRTVILGLGLATLLAACTGPSNTVYLSMEESLHPAVVRANRAAEAWLLANFQGDEFLYLYDPVRNEVPAENNMIRQLLASRLLAEMASARPELMPRHRANLQHIFENWYQESGGHGYIYFDRDSKLGANAMALRTLVYSPDFSRHAAKARRLADGILSLRREDGGLRPMYREKWEPDNPVVLEAFYSGEALLALLEYAERGGEDRYREAAVAIQDHYLEVYVDNIAENFMPYYVPWHTLSLHNLYRQTGDPRYARAVFTLNDELLKMLEREEQPGRFYAAGYRRFGLPHSASQAIYAESLVYALEVAHAAGDRARVRRYRDDLELAMKFLIALQYQPDEVPPGADPQRVVGGIRTSIADPRIRVDNVQHAVDAFRKTLLVLAVNP